MQEVPMNPNVPVDAQHPLGDVTAIPVEPQPEISLAPPTADEYVWARMKIQHVRFDEEGPDGEIYSVSGTDGGGNS